MDTIKDITQRDQVSRILAIKQSKTNPFGANVSGERVYRRVERLVAALHLLTAHVPERESSRMRLRELGVGLFSQVLAIRDEMRAPESSASQAIFKSIREVASLVQVLCASGFVSAQNAEAVVEAVDDIGAYMIAAQRTPLSESVVVERGSMADPQGVHKGHSVKDRQVHRHNRQVSVPAKDDTDQVSSRSERILRTLGAGTLMSIKDIAAQLPEYSEKMIQRELLSLIAQSRIKKIGLKRWSRYSRA